MKPGTHELVRKAYDETGLVRATDWFRGGKEVEGVKLQNLYQRVHTTVIDGKAFCGHGSWYEYLKNRHGIVLSDVHELVNFFEVQNTSYETNNKATTASAVVGPAEPVQG